MHKLAESEKLVCSEVVIFRDPPGDVLHRDALVQRPNTIPPMVIAAEVASQAKFGHMHSVRHAHNIWVERSDRVVGHQGYLVYVDALVALDRHSKIHWL